MHVASSGQWSLAAIIGTIIGGVVFLVAVGVFTLGVVGWRHKGVSVDGKPRTLDGELSGWLAVWAGGIAFVTAVAYVVCMFPLTPEYHQWRTTSGVVDSVSSRQVAKDKGMETKFVIQYKDGGERGCTDTRCALVKPGDTVTLKCKRSWQWQSTPGYDCNWVSRRAR